MDINATLMGQLIVFLILIWFTAKYIWPPMIQAMREREKRIAEGLLAAERSKQELEMAQHKVLAMMHEAKTEAQHIIDQANKRSQQLVEEAKVDARNEGLRILDNAKAEIKQEINRQREAMHQQMATIAVSCAERILRREIDASSQQALLNQLMAEM